MPSAVIMRPPADSYRNCLRKDSSEPIDSALARQQHAALAEVLTSLGAPVVRLPPLDEFPDSVFIEDAGLVIGNQAWVCPFAVPSRRGEDDSLRPTLAEFRRVLSFQPPATIDGGDVLVAERDVFVGLSGRTNEAAYDQLARALPDRCVQPIRIDTGELLHLKSGASSIGRGTMLVAGSRIDRTPFNDYDILETPVGEEDAANSLVINGTVILPAGFPKSRALLERHHFPVRQVDLSEFAKGDGSVSCLCLVIN